MNNKKFDSSWEMQDHIIDIIKKANAKGNKPLTLSRKIKTIFNGNNELFKNLGMVALWPDRYNDLERNSRCFNFVKSGFFRPENYERLMRISEILGVYAYVNDTYELKDSLGGEIKISKQDYFDLKRILK